MRFEYSIKFRHMTAEQFTYWLQGFFEIHNPGSIGHKETQIIQDHLKLVFEKQTPNRLTSIPSLMLA